MVYRNVRRLALAFMVAGSIGFFGSANQVPLAAAQAQDECGAGVIINGSIFMDTLNGGVNNDIIRGLEDNDLIRGGPCNDLLLGNEGDDYIYGGDGDDELRGGLGIDHCNGGGQAGDTFFSCEFIIP